MYATLSRLILHTAIDRVLSVHGYTHSPNCATPTHSCHRPSRACVWCLRPSCDMSFPPSGVWLPSLAIPWNHDTQPLFSTLSPHTQVEPQFDYIVVEAPGFAQPGFPRYPERVGLLAGTQIRWHTDASVHFGGFTLCAELGEPLPLPSAPLAPARHPPPTSSPTLSSSPPVAPVRSPTTLLPSSVDPYPGVLAPAMPSPSLRPHLSPPLAPDEPIIDEFTSAAGTRTQQSSLYPDAFVGIVAGCASCTLITVIIASLLVWRRRAMHGRGTRTIVTAVPMTTIQNPIANHQSAITQVSTTAHGVATIQPLEASKTAGVQLPTATCTSASCGGAKALAERSTESSTAAHAASMKSPPSILTPSQNLCKLSMPSEQSSLTEGNVTNAGSMDVEMTMI